MTGHTPWKKIKHKAHYIFCYVCKEHIYVGEGKRKDQLKRFHTLGHDNRKVAKLKRGLSGKYGEKTYS